MVSPAWNRTDSQGAWRFSTCCGYDQTHSDDHERKAVHKQRLTWKSTLPWRYRMDTGTFGHDLTRFHGPPENENTGWGLPIKSVHAFSHLSPHIYWLPEGISTFPIGRNLPKMETFSHKKP